MARDKEKTGLGRIYWRSAKIVLYGTVMILIYIVIMSWNLPSIEQLENFDPDLVTRLYSGDGVVLHELFLQKRVFTALDDIPLHLQNATIASEDKRFRQHWGIDYHSVIRALAVNLASLSFRQGFSSLSQQLARNLYKSIGFEDNINRKVKEIITAIQVERTYTKNEILEMYLNTIHFGHGTYGVEAAAKRFFARTASELTLGESAMLVGLLPSPAHYSPVNHPEKAIQRRNIVLRLMREQGYVNENEYITAVRDSLIQVQTQASKGLAPYFTEYVRRFLEQEDEYLNINIYRDGLKIYTTLDSRLQDIAEEAVAQSIEQNQKKFNQVVFADEDKFSRLGYLSIYSEDTVRLMMSGELQLYNELRDKLLVQCGFIALDPKTGAILAMVGGRPDYHDQYNRAVQAPRQPGSVFKPFVYTTAIDNGYPVTEQLLNQRVVLNTQNADGEWVKWNPRNYDGSTGGLTTLREGLRRSLNLISVRMVQQKLAPADQVRNTAMRMGLTTNIRPVDAIALGTSEVYLIEMAAAYSVFANKGVYSTPFAITRIEDRYGNVIKEYFPQQKEVLNERTAYLMTNLMQTVIDRGTGARSRWMYQFYHPAAGKTGTTQNWSDAWFAGFSPDIAACAWFGIDGPPMVSLGEGQSGNIAALPAWARFMRKAHQTLNLPQRNFDVPEGIIEIEICSVSKELPARACTVEKELFIEGTEPTRSCQIHKRF
ncbi:MAG: PBP1A family penicillin-binding protein [Candidatus Neomarinimicrobiota bacterium]